MIHASNKRALELCHFDATKHVFLEGSEGAVRHLPLAPPVQRLTCSQPLAWRACCCCACWRRCATERASPLLTSSPPLTTRHALAHAQLSFGESSCFSTEIHFYCEPNSEPIEPPGHQQGPAQWHGHQVLLSKFNGCVSGEYRIGLDAQRHVIFQREVSPWIVTTTDVIPLHEWHSIVCTYDGHFMRIYIDCRQAAHIACGPQKTDLTSPTLLGADLCGYASAHHFEGYISEVSLWQRSLDASEVKALANSNPLSSKTLSKDLIGYWCVYQRADAQSKIRNGVRLAGEQQFHGVYLREGTPLLDRWRGWLASGGEALPRPAKPVPGNHMGPLFGGKEGVYMHVTGSASRLSFGGTAVFTLAVQFCPLPTAARAAAPPTGGAAGSSRDAAAAATARPMILLSKFHAGLRGEFRLGLDAQLRPFFHREVEPWDLVAPTAVTANEWHELHATFDGHTMRLYVDRRLATSAKSGAQFTDQVTPVLIGAEFGRTSIENHFDGYISEARIWNRALSADEVVHAFAHTQPKSGANLLQRGLLAHWRPLDASLDEPDGRLTVFNLIAARANSVTTMDALLKRNQQTHPLELTLRAGVRAVLVELGSVTARSAQWRRGIQMVARKDEFKHYCYLGTSVALQKSLLQALDLHAHQLIAQRLSELQDPNDHSLKKLHSEAKQKLADVRGRGAQLYREWFFHNPISHLRECDGDRCEFWRFRYPKRREVAMNLVTQQAVQRFPPRTGQPLIISSFGSGLLFQEFTHVAKLVQEGYRLLRLVLVDTAYVPWKQKYLARDGCCRIYCQPTQELHPDMIRPAPAYSAPGTTKETLDSTASNAVNNAISFVLYNEAIFQFVQWFASEPTVDLQVLLYDSVDAYIADCQLAPNEVMAHVCTAIDYKDNDKLLEDHVNHMASNTLRQDGVCVKLVTRPGEALPGVYVEDRLRNVLHSVVLDNGHESHFQGRCQECEV